MAITILVDVESSQPLTDSELRHAMFECDYEVSGEGDFGFDSARYQMSDREMEGWELVAMREEA